jgi:hypothetical protein
MHIEMYMPPSATLEIKDTDNQADSQKTRRFLTRTEYQQSEGKEDCTANQALDTTNTNYKDREALLQLSLRDARSRREGITSQNLGGNSRNEMNIRNYVRTLHQGYG